MDRKRFFQTIRLCLTTSSSKRALYLKKKHIFKKIGDNCSYMDRRVPLYPNLISIGDNVHLASNIRFLTHDVTFIMMNKKFGGGYSEMVGCIEIGSNVFVGADTIILPNCRIGSNVVIGAGSLVAKDIPDNSVAVGIPAKVIGTFDEFAKKRRGKLYPDNMKPIIGKRIEKQLEEYLWNDFHKKHNRVDG